MSPVWLRWWPNRPRIGEKASRCLGDGGRDDLVVKERAALAVMLEYLPEQFSIEELEDMARQAIADVGAIGASDRGKVMGRIMPQVRGKADGSAVNAVVSRLLESLG